MKEKDKTPKKEKRVSGSTTFTFTTATFTTATFTTATFTTATFTTATFTTATFTTSRAREKVIDNIWEYSQYHKVTRLSETGQIT
jgi:dolichol kinase